MFRSVRSPGAVAPHLFRSVSYDVTKDFAPITLVARSPTILVANSSVPAANLAEFVAYAKAQPAAVRRRSRLRVRRAT